MSDYVRRARRPYSHHLGADSKALDVVLRKLLVVWPDLPSQNRIPDTHLTNHCPFSGHLSYT